MSKFVDSALTISDQTRGRGTHTLPAIWQGYLQELLGESQP
jgi:homoserine O-acetyltransferase